MDLTAIISSIALVALITIPFIIHHLRRKKKENKFLMEVISLTGNKNVKISHKEFWRDGYAICMDDNSRKIVYRNSHKEKGENAIIDLSEVEKCRIVNKSRKVNNPTGNNIITDRLELVFTFRRADLPEKVLEFYDSSVFLTADGELPLIEKWLGIVNSNMEPLKS
jgi:hypothetical protein